MHETGNRTDPSEVKEYRVTFPSDTVDAFRVAAPEFGAEIIGEGLTVGGVNTGEGIVFPDLSWKDELDALKQLVDRVEVAWREGDELSAAGMKLLLERQSVYRSKTKEYVGKLVVTLRDTIDQYSQLSHRRSAYNRSATRLSPKDIRIVTAAFCLDGEFINNDEIMNREGLKPNSFSPTIDESCSHLRWAVDESNMSSIILHSRLSWSGIREALKGVASKQTQN